MKIIRFSKNKIQKIMTKVSVVLSISRHNFCSRAPFEKNDIPLKIISFSISKKKIQKIMTKIENVGTYSKSNLSLKGTIVLTMVL